MKKVVNLVLGIIFTSSVFSQNDVENKANFNANNTGFIENKGQIVDLEYKLNPNVLYLLNGNGLNVHLRQTGFSYDVYTIERVLAEKNSEQRKSKFDEEKENYIWHFHRVDIELLGCNSHALIDARQKSSDFTNYYTPGTPDEGVLEVYNYQEVYYYNIYNKIDLQFLVKNGKPKYNFILHPGADIADIKLYFKGANRTSLTENAEIQIETNHGTVLEKLPLSYYKETGEEIKLRPFKISENTFGIIGDLSNDKTVVIDPIPTIVWNTFYGDLNSDFGHDVVCVGDNIVIVGETRSTNNIASSGHQNSIGGFVDAFIALFDTTGVRKWASYYGGSDNDVGKGVTFYKKNSIYVCGWTRSSNKISLNGFQNNLNGLSDGYLVKFDFMGKRIWGTYYGGDNYDLMEKVVTDNASNIYVVGTAESDSNISFLGHQNNYGGQEDGFIAKFDSLGTRLWASYYGGAKDDDGQGVTVDNNGDVVICGSTLSDSNIFYNGHQGTLGSNVEGGYMVKFDSSGQRKWGTFYNGQVKAIAIDSENNIYAAGKTKEKIGIAFKAQKNVMSGNEDGFLAKFNALGIRLWSTYYGGNEVQLDPTDEINKIAVGSTNGIYIVGETTSDEGIISWGHQPRKDGESDAFLSKFDSSGQFIWGTYFGGKDYDFGTSTCVDSNENIYITGWSRSSDLYNQLQSQYKPHQPKFIGGKYSAFLARFSETDAEFSSKLNKKYCFLDTMEIAYKITGNVLTKFNSNNTFFIEVSDTTGKFSLNNIPKVESFQDSSMSGIFKFRLIPQTSWRSGSGYRLRLRSTNPPGYWELPDTISYRRELPKASFFGSMVTSCVDDNHLWTTNTSSPAVGMPTAYLWEFGNGDTSSSTSKYLNYTGYKQAGQYTVTLTLTDTFGCSHVASKVIEVSDNPIADFSVDSTTVCARDMLNLKDLSDPSSGTIKNWYWTFSDGKSSTWNNLTHSFDSSGIHAVKLKVRNNYGCYDSIEKLITVYPKPDAFYEVIKTPGKLFCFNDNKVSFKNTTKAEANSDVSYYWEFGDGDTSTQKEPIKTYLIKGEYNPILIALDTSYRMCADTFFYGVKVVKFESLPVADFDITSAVKQCQRGNSYSFQNTSSIKTKPLFATEWLISGQTITTTNTSGSFNISGVIPIRLRTTDITNSCWDTITKYISVVPTPMTSIIAGASTSKGKKQEIYSVVNTVGSSYSWSVNGGTVINGQGTSQITVRWNENSGVTGTVSVIEASSDNCIGDAVSKTVSLTPSSISEINNKYRISLYPNPTKGDLNIDIGNYKGDYNLTIFNSLGQKVGYFKNLNDNVAIKLNNLVPALYVVKLEGQDFVRIEKIHLE